MKEYKVEITEILSKSVRMKANSEEDAIEKVLYLYENEEIILDSDNFIDKELKVINYE